MKHVIAVALTAVVVSAPLGSIGSDGLFTGKLINPVVAHAIDYASGTTKAPFSIESTDHSYRLYFDKFDKSNKTVSVVGCYTDSEKNSNEYGFIVNIPESVEYNGVKYNVTSIGNSAFSEQKNITSVCIPKNVSKIGDYAFKNCESPSSIDLRNIKTIGNNAFENCVSLNYADLRNIESMGSYAFSGCYSLSLVDFIGNSTEATLDAIPEGAFSGCTNICFQINIPSTVKKIGKKAFYNVLALKSFDLTNVTSIGDSAFEDCHNLETVFTGENLSSIGNKAFYGCDPMTYFVCKNSSVNIGSQALGYAHQRNYTGKKANFTLWGTNGGGNANTYAVNNGFAYKNAEDAPNNTIEKFKPYTWSCGNVELMFGDSKGNRLFIDEHKPYVTEKYLTEKFTGSCAGMAAISALAYNGYISVDQFASGYNSISYIDTVCSEYIKSFVNTIYANNNMGYNIHQHFNPSSDVLKYIEHINYTGEVATFSYYSDKKSLGHAIVCLGMEYKENAEDKDTNPQWNGMDARILLYDVNYSYFDYTNCLYFNFENGDWKMGKGSDPDAYSLTKNPGFTFALAYKADKMIFGGMEKVNTLIARRDVYDANTDIIKFNPNGGVARPQKSVTVRKGTQYNSVLSDAYYSPTRKGYKFEGFYTSPTGGTKVYNNDRSCVKGTKYFDSKGNWIYGKDLDLYAHWTPKTYTLTLNPNGGTSGPQKTATMTYGKEDYYWLNSGKYKPSREGYVFEGFYTSSTGGTKVYNNAC